MNLTQRSSIYADNKFANIATDRRIGNTVMGDSMDGLVGAGSSATGDQMLANIIDLEAQDLSNG